MLRNVAERGHQRKPATKRRLAGAGRSCNVNRPVRQPVQQERVPSFFAIRRLPPDGLHLGDARAKAAGARPGQGRHIDLPQARALRLPRVETEQIHRLAAIDDPSEVGLAIKGSRSRGTSRLRLLVLVFLPAGQGLDNLSLQLVFVAEPPNLTTFAAEPALEILQRSLVALDLVEDCVEIDCLATLLALHGLGHAIVFAPVQRPVGIIGEKEGENLEAPGGSAFALEASDALVFARRLVARSPAMTARNDGHDDVRVLVDASYALVERRLIGAFPVLGEDRVQVGLQHRGLRRRPE